MEYVDATKSDNSDNKCCQSFPHLELISNSRSTENLVAKETPDTIIQHENNTDKSQDMAATTSQQSPVENVDFIVIYNKQKINVNLPLDSTVADLKVYVRDIIKVPGPMQKVMFKTLAKDEQTLRSLGITKGAKVMIVGSKVCDVLAVTVPTKEDLEKCEESVAATEPLSCKKIHRKILDKGIPDDAMPGILDSKEPLPDFPLAGMLNKSGGKVRLTFKLEQDQLWIGTKERTEKIPMNSIKSVHSEPIYDHPEYHIMAIQLGTTEASRYWIYWVPAQYISAIKDAILGKWCYF